MATYGGAKIDATGRLGNPPEFAFTNGGVARCQLSIAVGTRIKDGDQYTDGETAWYRVTVWREAAEKIAEAELQKGDTIRVVGLLRPSTYQEKLYLNVEDAEVSIVIDRFQTGRAVRDQRPQGQQQPQQRRPQARPQQDPAAAAGWGPAPQASAGGWGTR